MKNLTIRPLEDGDVAPISTAFDSLGWNKPRTQYKRYLSEQQRGVRAVFVAFVDDEFTGYVTVNWNPTYPPFREDGIPEIQDFNVLPRFRRQGLGTRLMDEAEREVFQRSTVAGIGVGMSPDYGAAQRLYVLRGYVPDAQGLTCSGSPVKHGDDIVVNEALVLYLTKSLAAKSLRRLLEARYASYRKPCSYRSLGKWSNLLIVRIPPVDNSQNPTPKAKNRRPRTTRYVSTNPHRSYT